jgi:hypothetical protein
LSVRTADSALGKYFFVEPQTATAAARCREPGTTELVSLSAAVPSDPLMWTIVGRASER